LGAGFFTVGGVLHENGASWWLWLWLAGHGFVWPHIAHLWIRSSHDPDATENLNRLIDHFSSGVWIAAIQFNFMPAAIMFTLLSMNNMIAGGWRACLRGMLCHLTGIGVGVLMFGARWQPHSSMPVMLACIPVLLLNPFMVGQTTWRALVKLRRQRAELKRLSLMDSLTGLANRRKFFADVEALCVHQEPGDATQPQRFALGVLDLDGFKSVNDLHGHAAGDQLLEQVAQRLQSLCGDGVSIARLGGD
jgi:diguanylate cyclase